MTVQELNEKRARLAAELRALDKAASGRAMTAEEEANWQRANADYDAVMTELQAAQRAEERRQRLDELERTDASLEQRAASRARQTIPDVRHAPDRDGDVVTDETRALALRAWMRHQAGLDLRPAERRACRQVGARPTARGLRFGLSDGFGALQECFRTVHPREAERRAMSVTLAGSGGTWIPSSFARTLEVNMLAFGGVLQVASIMSTSGGEDLSMPTADDTGNIGAQIGENTAADLTSTPSTGAVKLGAYKFTSKGVRISQEMLEDSALDVAGFLAQALGERLGRIMNRKFTSGSGAATPRGIVTAATTGVTTASATAIKADEVIDLIHSVDPAYRALSPSFMLHDSVLAYLRKLKDGNGQYLWQPGMAAGVPDRLYNYPYVINNDMDATVTSGKKTLLFGALGKYLVRMVGGIRMYRLAEREREYDRDIFIAFVRADGNLLDAGTPPVKVLVQA